MRAILVAAALVASGCHPEDIDAMERQPKLLPYAASDISPSGQAMRAPPRGSIPRERDLAEAQPEVTAALLATGRQRYDVYCGLCHGITGDGDSIIAGKMGQRPPPSLHEQRLRDLPAGEIYRVVTEGYGVMPSYASRLSAHDRWAIVAYVRALQVSQRLPVADAPEPLRRRIEEAP